MKAYSQTARGAAKSLVKTCLGVSVNKIRGVLMVLVSERGSHGKTWALQGDMKRVFLEKGRLDWADAV